MEWIEQANFPGGLNFGYESHVGDEYIADLKAVVDAASLKTFQDKWVYLLPEMEAPVDVAEIVKSRADKHHLPSDDLVNYLVPPTLLAVMLEANKFGVPDGTILIQLHNADRLTVTPEGRWRRVKK